MKQQMGIMKDETAMNGIQFKCSDDQVLQYPKEKLALFEGPDGKWSDWMSCDKKEYGLSALQIKTLSSQVVYSYVHRSPFNRITVNGIILLKGSIFLRYPKPVWPYYSQSA